MQNKMRQGYRLVLAIAVVLGQVLNTILVLPVLGKSNGQSPSSNLPAASTVKLHGGISALAGACAGAGITIEASTLPTTITKVRMGSPAAYGGICDGDQLIQGKIGSDTMQLLIERGGKRYGITLRYTPDNLIAKKINKKEQLRLSSEATKDADWKKLKAYDIVLLIDASGSMDGPVESSSETRWRWCQDQIYAFAREAQTLGSGSFSFCTFQNSHTLKNNCTASDARQIMEATRPEGGTDLSSPLSEILTEGLAKPRTKPLLVVIVSDGMPNQGLPVELVIMDAAKKIKSEKDVQIVFLQIGNDGPGKILANYLDNDLTMEGAPFDIVSSIETDDLESLGLRRGLIAAMNKTATPVRQSNPAIEAELVKVRAELARLRAQKATQSK